MKNPAKFLLSTTPAFALFLVGCTPSDPKPEGVEMTLENVTYLEWESLDERPEYRIDVDGDVLLTTRRSAGYIHYDGPIDGLRVRATDPNDRQGDAVTEVEKIKAEQKERLIIRWDRAIYPQPYLGIRLGGARLATKLNEQPYLITHDPNEIELLLFGNEVDREDAIVNAPFEIHRNHVQEFGPHHELPIPGSRP